MASRIDEFRAIRAQVSPQTEKAALQTSLEKIEDRYSISISRAILCFLGCLLKADSTYSAAEKAAAALESHMVGFLTMTTVAEGHQHIIRIIQDNTRNLKDSFCLSMMESVGQSLFDEIDGVEREVRAIRLKCDHMENGFDRWSSTLEDKLGRLLVLSKDRQKTLQVHGERLVSLDSKVNDIEESVSYINASISKLLFVASGGVFMNAVIATTLVVGVAHVFVRRFSV